MKDTVNDGRPVLLYDSDCQLCVRSIQRLKSLAADDIRCVPLKEAASLFSSLNFSDLQREIHLVEANGTIWRGAGAVFRALSKRRGWAAGFWLYRRVPFFARISETVYSWVARHRS